MNTIAPVFAVLLRRELLLGLRHRSALLNPISFYFMGLFLFGLALGPQKDALPGTAAAIAWVVLLFAEMLSLQGMFESDFEDGSLDQFLVAPSPLVLLVAAKVTAHWLACGLPLIVAALVGAAFLDLPRPAAGVLAATLLLGTPVISLNGAVLSALTVGLRGGGLLLALLILPLCVPVLLFALGAVTDAAMGLPATGALYVLAALLVFAATVMPPAAAASLRARMT
jgi:heme exporter protein B